MLTEGYSPPSFIRKKKKRSEYLSGHFPPDFFGEDQSKYTRAKKKYLNFEKAVNIIHSNSARRQNLSKY